MNRLPGPSRDHCAPEPSEESQEDHVVAGEVRLALRQMGPWMTSFCFHLGIVVLALMLVWMFVEETDQDGPIIKTSVVPTKQALFHQSKSPMDSKPAPKEAREVVTDDTTKADVILEKPNTESRLLLGVRLPAGGGHGDIGKPGDRHGNTDGDGLFDPPGGVYASRIIYVIDASGSLIDSMPFALRELRQSIAKLNSGQQFNAIFFQDGSAIEMPVPHQGWKYATGDVKQATANWLNGKGRAIVPRGRTDPTQALKLAMQYEPELVFLLSDNITGRGRYEINRSEIFAVLDQADPERKVAIHTIQYLSPDPSNTLALIAKRHHGAHKFVTEVDLGLRRH